MAAFLLSPILLSHEGHFESQLQDGAQHKQFFVSLFFSPPCFLGDYLILRSLFFHAAALNLVLIETHNMDKTGRTPRHGKKNNSWTQPMRSR